MKKYFLTVLIVVASLVLGISVASAASDNAAIVVKSDGGCFWFADQFFATGRLVYVETQNGHWKLSCKADSYFGPSLSEALVFRSSAKDPLGTCSSPAGDTNKFIIVFTPSGQTHLTCQGDSSISYP
jgi:hypothetical protein